MSHNVVVLTLRPSDLTPSALLSTAHPLPRPSFHSLEVGQRHVGYLQEVNENTVWLLLGPTLRGRELGVSEEKREDGEIERITSI